MAWANYGLSISLSIAEGECIITTLGVINKAFSTYTATEGHYCYIPLGVTHVFKYMLSYMLVLLMELILGNNCKWSGSWFIILRLIGLTREQGDCKVSLKHCALLFNYRPEKQLN